MRKLKQFMLLLFAAIAFYACQKDNSTGTANLIGYAYLYDVNGIRETDNSGISVRVEGASDSTTTGTDGKWTLSRLNAGTYNFVLSKPNFNPVTYQGFKFSGNGQTFGSTSLFQTPPYNIVNLSDTFIQRNNSINIFGSFSGTLPTVYCYHLYFGFNSNVSPNSANYFYTTVVTGNLLNSTFSTTISLYYFPNDWTIYLGDTLYVVAYTDNSSANINVGAYVYPGLSPTPSNVAKLIIPL